MRSETSDQLSTAPATPVVPRLRISQISKDYIGVRALSTVSFDVAKGEIVGLVGHNGAGKSTLSKILAGLERPSSGVISIDGTAVAPRSAKEAVGCGIGLVPQRLAVVDTLTVRSNILLGHRPANGTATIDQTVAELGIAGLLDLRVGHLSPALQRVTMIARALVRDPRILILDEATAAFSVPEVERLFTLVRRLRARGISIIYVSHRLAEVLELADRIVALGQGSLIADRPTAELDKQQLADLIAGRHVAHVDQTDASSEPPARAREQEPARRPRQVALACRGVAIAPKLHDVNLEIQPGEIVGLTGLVGSGRTTLLNALWGVAGKVTGGEVAIGGKPFQPRSPRDAIRRGVAYAPENRARNSLIGSMTVRENVTLPSIRGYRQRLSPLVIRASERKAVAPLLQRLSVSPPDAIELRIASLSGGNQQKTIIARWLLLNVDLLLFDEPTEGVDIGGRNDIYIMLRELAKQGAGVLISSSDVEEVVDQCDRVLIMRDGTIATELTGSDQTLERVSRACIT